MSEHRRLAVLIVRNDTSVAPVTPEQAKRLVVNDQSSIFRYWRENAENWFSISPPDIFGSYDVTLTPSPDSRFTTLAVAQAAAQNAGIDLSPYDGFIVILHPGKSGGNGYDGGSTGSGPGKSSIMTTSDSATIYCHEIGHLLGFEHTYGILNSGADTSPDGAWLSTW
jgi:hypothetical protein